MHFYDFIDALKAWYRHLEQPPTTIEEAENLIKIKLIAERYPHHLNLTFIQNLS